jgi:hypothetical protein
MLSVPRPGEQVLQRGSRITGQAGARHAGSSAKQQKVATIPTEPCQLVSGRVEFPTVSTVNVSRILESDTIPVGLSCFAEIPIT